MKLHVRPTRACSLIEALELGHKPLISAIAVLAALGVPATAAAADRPLGFFPACSASDEMFCIESATKNDANILGTSYYVNASFLDENSINWSIGLGSAYGELPSEDIDATFRFVIRTGDLEPLYTYAIADRFHLVASGDGANGYRVEIEATLASIHWSFADGFSCTTAECGDDETRATVTASGRRLSGNTQNMALWGEEERARFGGTYVATNAQALSTVLIFEPSPTPRWYLDLANPHLDVDGNPVSGSFTAWVPPSYFETLGTTASAALETGFDVTRTEGGVPEALSASVTLDNGGTLVRVESVSYSAPRITVAESAGGGGDPAPDAGAGSGVDAGSGSGGSGGASGGSGGAGAGTGGTHTGGTNTGGASTGGADPGSPAGSGGSDSGAAGSPASGGTGGSGSGGAGDGGSDVGAGPSDPSDDGSAGSSTAPVRPRNSGGGCSVEAASSASVASLGAGALLGLFALFRRRAKRNDGNGARD